MTRDPADWKTYCYEMAEAVYKLANQADKPATARLLLDLAAKWIAIADLPPGAG